MMKSIPYISYQVVPVLIAAIALGLLIPVLGMRQELQGKLFELCLWLCDCAFFKLLAPSAFRNDRVILWTLLTAAILFFPWSPVALAISFTTALNDYAFWLPAPLLLLLEYLWPFPPEK